MMMSFMLLNTLRPEWANEVKGQFYFSLSLLTNSFAHHLPHREDDDYYCPYDDPACSTGIGELLLYALIAFA